METFLDVNKYENKAAEIKKKESTDRVSRSTKFSST